MKDTLQYLEDAIEHCGGQAALGRGMKKSQQYVWHMLNVRKSVTADDAVAIESATDGKFSRSLFRPDLWPAQSPDTVDAA